MRHLPIRLARRRDRRPLCRNRISSSTSIVPERFVSSIEKSASTARASACTRIGLAPPTPAPGLGRLRSSYGYPDRANGPLTQGDGEALPACA